MEGDSMGAKCLSPGQVGTEPGSVLTCFTENLLRNVVGVRVVIGGVGSKCIATLVGTSLIIL